MSSCICGTPGEVDSVESVADADIIAVDSLEVVSEVVPVRVLTWVSINGASLLAGSSRVGLKAFGCLAMVIIGCSIPGGGRDVERGSKV